MEYYSAMKINELQKTIRMKMILISKIKRSQADELIPLHKVQKGRKRV